jgi:hypothetical protein
MPLEGLRMVSVSSNTGSVLPDAFATPSRVTVTDSILRVVKGPALGGGGGACEEGGADELAVGAGVDDAVEVDDGAEVETGAEDGDEDGGALRCGRDATWG